MKITQLGEFALVERFVKKFSKYYRPLAVKIGDDSAAIKISPESCLLVTKDIFVERVHFRCDWSNFFQIGYKALVANISDIAAMGGARELYAVVGLATTVDISVDNVDKLSEGISSAAQKYGVLVVGGDTVLSRKDIVISVTLFGIQNVNQVIKRSGAKAGDLICATGTFGDAAAGIEVIKKNQHKKYRQLVHAHQMPTARLKESLIISQHKAANSMIDSSDGLAASVNLLCKASGVGARVHLEKIPLSDEFRKWAEEQSEFPWEIVLNGGEEFELVFTAPPQKLNLISQKIKFSVIGEIVKEKTVRYLLNGKKTKYKPEGYQNF